MWKSSDIHDDMAYVVQLCHGEDGVRYARLRDVANDAELGDYILETDIVPNEILRGRNLASISENVLLSNGSRFVVDGHGVWYTIEEWVVLDGAAPIPWCTETPPRLPPK